MRVFTSDQINLFTINNDCLFGIFIKTVTHMRMLECFHNCCLCLLAVQSIVSPAMGINQLEKLEAAKAA